MLALREIEEQISLLPKKDFSILRKWFYNKDFEEWDNQIESDSKHGKLDFLFKEALSEKENDQLKLL